jgi:hypothetical protein
LTPTITNETGLIKPYAFGVTIRVPETNTTGSHPRLAGVNISSLDQDSAFILTRVLNGRQSIYLLSRVIATENGISRGKRLLETALLRQDDRIDIAPPTTVPLVLQNVIKSIIQE